ncbi:MAG: HNH endonuclease [Xanthobacteraceae bacterium]
MHGDETKDKKELERAARNGRRIPTWIVPKTARVNDEVIVKVGPYGFFATASIASVPKPRPNWKRRYGAALKSIKLIEPPISLHTVLQQMPEFVWVQYPRSVTTPRPDVATKLRGLIKKAFKRGKSKTNTQNDLIPDLETIYENVDSKTTRRALIEARLGQGKFRTGVERRWNSQCAMTGAAISSILRASHIKPWSKSTNKERLNPANGILLSAHVDALFDCGLISFSDSGKLLISSAIARQIKQLKLPSKLRRAPTKSERLFLAYHRDRVFAA